MARPDEFEATALTLPHTPPLTLTAERAIRDREDGTMHLEWTDVPREHLLEVIEKSQTPDKYEIMVRYVTAWEVEK